MSRRYDAVVIGGGHNGLVAACYLAGAGLSVAVLERAPVVGGAAVTEELITGYRVSTGSYVLSLMPRRILDDLDLWSAGLQYLARDPRIFVPFPDGTSLTWWSDPARLHAELAKISKRDADRFADYEAFIERAASVMDRNILRMALFELLHELHRRLGYIFLVTHSIALPFSVSRSRRNLPAPPTARAQRRSG